MTEVLKAVYVLGAVMFFLWLLYMSTRPTPRGEEPYFSGDFLTDVAQIVTFIGCALVWPVLAPIAVFNWSKTR